MGAFAAFPAEAKVFGRVFEAALNLRGYVTCQRPCVTVVLSPLPEFLLMWRPPASLPVSLCSLFSDDTEGSVHSTHPWWLAMTRQLRHQK